MKSEGSGARYTSGYNVIDICLKVCVKNIKDIFIKLTV